MLLQFLRGMRLITAMRRILRASQSRSQAMLYCTAETHIRSSRPETSARIQKASPKERHQAVSRSQKVRPPNQNRRPSRRQSQRLKEAAAAAAAAAPAVGNFIKSFALVVRCIFI